MKKIALISIAALSLLAVSCEKDGPLQTRTEDNSSKVFSINAITAIGEDTPITKNELDKNGVSTHWLLGDRISVFYGSQSDGFLDAAFTCNSVSDDGMSVGSFYSSNKIKGSEFYAMYPEKKKLACENNEIFLSKDLTLNTFLNPEQIATANSFGPNANLAVATGTVSGNGYSVDMSFKNVGVIIGFQITESNINGITINSDQPLAGSIKVDPATAIVKEAADDYTVRIKGTFTSGNTYYAVILPGTHKLSVTYSKTDGSSATVTATNAVTLARNTRYIVMNQAMPKAYTTPAKVYINEISFNADDKTKWIEFYNPGDSEVDMSGWTLLREKDDNAIDTYIFPEGTKVAAKGFLTKELKSASGIPFGISGTTKWRLWLNCGAEVDFVDNWTNPTTVKDGRTFGRETDGDPDWIIFMNNGTKAASNASGTPYDPALSADGLVLNEIDANKGFIEIYNSTDVQKSLEGIKVYLNDIHTPVWTGTSECTIPAKGYVVLGGLDNTVGVATSSPLYFGAALSNKTNTKVEVDDSEGNLVGNFIRGVRGEEWGKQGFPYSPNYSFSYTGSTWVYATPTAGEANGSEQAEIENESLLRINEIFCSTKEDINGDKKFIELYNYSEDSYVDLTGYKIRKYHANELGKETGSYHTIWKGLEGHSLAPGQYLVLSYYGVKLEEQDQSNWDQLQNNIRDGVNMKMWLMDANDTVLNEFVRGEENNGYGLMPMAKSPVGHQDTCFSYSYDYSKNEWVWTEGATPGETNPKTSTYTIDQELHTIVFNEVCDKKKNGETRDFIELHNIGNKPASLNGITIRKNGDEYDEDNDIWKATNGDTIPADGYYVIEAIDNDFGISGKTNLKLSLVKVVNGKTCVWEMLRRGEVGKGWGEIAYNHSFNSLSRVGNCSPYSDSNRWVDSHTDTSGSGNNTGSYDVITDANGPITDKFY